MWGKNEMEQHFEKDLYSILGVAINATQEEIREAYLARVRILHPDRFDKQRQPMDWQIANQMLQELNHAYFILGDPQRRRDYDEMRASRFRNKEKTSSSFSSSDDFRDLPSGTVNYNDLPADIQKSLLERQEGKKREQFQLKLESITDHLLLSLITIVCGFGWFWILFSEASESRLDKGLLAIYLPITLIISLLIGYSVTKLVRWRSSTLKPCIYITPLYFIKTAYDIVDFRPILTLNNVNVINQYINGIYAGSRVSLEFRDGHKEHLRLSWKRLNQMLEIINTYRLRILNAYSKGDYDYLKRHNEFDKVYEPDVFGKTTTQTNYNQMYIYVASVVLCNLSLFMAIEMNDVPGKQQVRDSAPIAFTQTPDYQTKKSPIYKENNKEKSTEEIFSKPKESEKEISDQLSIQPSAQSSISQADKRDEEYFVSQDEEDSVSSQDENDKTRSLSPIKLPSPRVLSSPPPNLNFDNGNFDDSDVLKKLPIYELPLPQNGVMDIFTSEDLIAPFEIMAGQDNHFLLKLVDISTKEPVLTIFVRKGTTVRVKVPIGIFEVKYASGKSWYGKKYLFGPDTVYGKFDRTIEFERFGNLVVGNSLTLYSMPFGNIGTQSIEATDF